MRRKPAPAAARARPAERQREAQARLKVDMAPLDDLVRAMRDDNPKDHDVGAIIMSMRRFGFTAPVQLDAATGKLFAGHGRVLALASMLESGEGPPRRVAMRAGRWLVPVLRGVAFDSDLEALAYAIADNRTNELGGWLEPRLADALQRLPLLEGTGFNAEDLQDLLKRLAGPGLGRELDEGIAAGISVCVCKACGHEHHRTKKE